MKKILALSILYLCVCVSISYAATGNITKIVFTNDIRSVDPDLTSEVITIQAQNASGNEEKLDSTADITFTSTSATGEFLGGTGKAVTKTMNSGSANKTFYYRDSTEGEHTITVKVVPRTGGDGWTTEQKIYIGVENTSGENNEADVDENGDEESDDEFESSSVSTNGAHSGTAKATTYAKSQTLKVGAGRNRIVLVNTPIYFEAETNQVSKKVVPNLDHTWSFGDGDSDAGRKVKHVYYFPGEYNVILTTYYQNEKITSRTKVKVIDNLITVASSSPGLHGFIEIRNGSNSEVNINGWELRSNNREYVISTDTLINPKGSIRIPNKVINFEPTDNIELLFPTNEIAHVYSRPKQVEKMQHIVSVKEVLPVEQEIPFEIEEPNYATTVQAAVITSAEKKWWTYLKALFGVE